MFRRRLRKRLLVLGPAVLAGLALAACALLTYYGSGRRVTKEAVLQAKPGLTLAQVEGLFGGPGQPARFADDPSQPGSVLLVLNSPSRNWVKTELARDPAATWRVWRGSETDGDEVYWVVYFRNGIVVDTFGVGGPGFYKRLRYQVERWCSWVGL